MDGRLAWGFPGPLRTPFARTHLKASSSSGAHDDDTYAIRTCSRNPMGVYVPI
jgi:hypothetical protein